MSDSKDLQGQKGLDKMTELVNEISLCMFCTFTSEDYFETRPMATMKVDKEGKIWFLSDERSDKNKDLKNDEKAQLLYAKPQSSEFLSVRGTATTTKDRDTIAGLWSKLAEAWFKGGKNDPALAAICFTPTEAYYWDTKHGKMVSLLKIAAAAFSSKVADDGVEGRIKP